ncbi:hypothetical protein RHDC4_00021 [Rhodocyclaceae bacterium]|nr:hypothetical protein RHDC4_00021 [Rhodocyclaceae bacterium]
MSQSSFQPQNDLETKLLAALAGDLSSEDFMQDLIDATLFVPVRDERGTGVKGLQRSTNAVPLVIEEEDGVRVLIAFTSPERAKDFLFEFPDYGGGLVTEFSWVLERLEPGYAVAINPGLEAGIDVDPEIVVQMLEVMAARAAAN